MGLHIHCQMGGHRGGEYSSSSLYNLYIYIAVEMTKIRNFLKIYFHFVITEHFTPWPRKFRNPACRKVGVGSLYLDIRCIRKG